MNRISLLKRATWMLLVIAIQFIYFPTSQATSGGIAPKLAIDVIPVHTTWVVPYYLCYPFWMFSMIWVLLKLKDGDFRAFTAAALFTVGIGNLTFILFPTYVDLPVIPGDDIFARMLRYIQIAGGTHAALPSAHNFLTMLFCSTFIHLYPRYRWVWVGIIATVALATLFTGQHYILDVVAGLLLGFVGFWFGQWWGNRRSRGQA